MKKITDWPYRVSFIVTFVCQKTGIGSVKIGMNQLTENCFSDERECADLINYERGYNEDTKAIQ